MKKFTLLIASLFMTIGAMAQTTYDFSHPTGNVTHAEHYPKSVSITDSDGRVQTVSGIATATRCPAYFDKTENIFYVCSGETVTPNIVINGYWMHGYAYVDWNNDEHFTVNLTGSGPYSNGEGNELVSYTYYGNSNGQQGDGWNSAGESAGGSALGKFGSFTVPDGLAVGTQLRMRFTVMWNCIDPTGLSYAGDKYFSDGASIIDVTLEIVAPATAEEKAELSKYIGKAGDVLDRFAEKVKVKGDNINIVGKISSNAGQNENNTGGNTDGAGIAGLTDTNATTYFHSRWGGTYVDEDHYLQIDLGEGETLSNFVFEYAVRGRNDDNTNETSPAPTEIKVSVSENGADFEQIATITKAVNGLPSYTDLGKTLWCSDVIEAGIDARYIRFTVTEVEGPGNIAWDGTSAYNASNRNGRGHVFFGLGTLNLYSTKEVDAVKGEYAEKYTVEQVNAINESLAAANSIDLNKEFVNGAVSELKEALSPFYHLLNVSAAGYATLYLGFDAEIPTGAEAYIVKEEGVNEDYISLEAIAGVIPAEAGVIVKSAEGEYDFMATNVAAANVEGNLLRGSVADEYVQGAAYVLANGEVGVGLYKAVLNKNATGGEGETHFLNNANKAYLPAVAGAANVASYSFRFGEGTTGVEKVEIRNEKSEIYDLTGRRVEAITAPGIYVVNGKKVLVK